MKRFKMNNQGAASHPVGRIRSL